MDPAYLKFEVVFGLMNVVEESAEETRGDEEDAPPKPLDGSGFCFFFWFINRDADWRLWCCVGANDAAGAARSSSTGKELTKSIVTRRGVMLLSSSEGCI